MYTEHRVDTRGANTVHTAEHCRVQRKMGPLECGLEHRSAGEIWEVWGDEGEIREMWGDVPCLGVRDEDVERLRDMGRYGGDTGDVGR